MRIRVKILNEGDAEGEIVAYNFPISFLGEVNAKNGEIIFKDKKISIKDKILIFPNTRGSTVGSYVIYALKYYNNAPKAIIVEKAEPILIAGCVLSGIPLAEDLEGNLLKEAKKYSKAKLDSKEGILFLY
ncbi:putative aconitase, subunit [Fervidicoccus fontis Kam940]|uniref:Putative aconitase, subunit n=1 Tax=Fervidicoccus fontis (strain DSM 19380 / JCM 18336 / VKM B-2539 / Kam940) TaxID=1163730 RepID=I0A252_FERFK|nr:putative aconitase, subunit [Fervidicoccus fontis Kam940]